MTVWAETQGIELIPSGPHGQHSTAASPRALAFSTSGISSHPNLFSPLWPGLLRLLELQVVQSLGPGMGGTSSAPTVLTTKTPGSLEDWGASLESRIRGGYQKGVRVGLGK